MVNEGRKKTLIAVCGGIIGAGVFLMLYGAGTLDIYSVDWLRGGYIEQDLAQHYAGWRLFAASDWTWPLAVGKNLLYPNGASALFSDSIPLFAVVFKTLSPVIDKELQYFGVFVFLSFVLQGVSSSLLVGRFVESPATVLFSSALFCCSPILLERAFRHCSLTAQWLLLFALYFYFEAKRTGKLSRWYFALLILAEWIHPYFLPPLFAVLLAFCVENALESRKLARLMAPLALGIALTLIFAVPLGVFYGGFPESEGGYGWFSLNLNAFLNPLSKGVESWSSVMPLLAQTNGNLDGFNYLGLGVITALFAAALSLFFKKEARDRTIKLVRRHWGLLAVTVILLAYAFSNVGTFAASEVWAFSLPSAVYRLCSIFRASGRMAWLFYYLAMLSGAVFVARLGRKKSVVGMLCAALLLSLQLYDISPALAEKREDFSDLSSPLMPENVLTGGFWDEARGKYDIVVALDGYDLSNRIPLAVWAAENDMAVNIGYFGMNVSKENAQYLSSVREQMKTGELDKRTLVLATDFDSSAGLFDEVCEDYGIRELDGFFIAEKGEKGDIDKNAFVASDLDEGDYENGVNKNAGIIAVNNTERNAALLLKDGAFEITASGSTFTVQSAQQDGAYINLWIGGTPGSDAGYPTVLSVTSADE